MSSLANAFGVPAETVMGLLAALGSGLLIVNPGAVGLPAYDVSRPYPLSTYHRVENGSPDARYAIAERGIDGLWQAELHAVAYDHAPVVALARQNRREDWAVPLATGYALR